MSVGRFDGLRALVTGAASGIGLATANALDRWGARVVILDRDLDGLGPGLMAVRADVTNDGAVRAAVAEAVERLGGLDILVNNAGIGAASTAGRRDCDSDHHRDE